MILYPAIDLRHGKVVQLVGGDPKNVALERPDVDAQAKAWEDAKATWVHVVDLDAAFGEKNQWSLLTRILGRRLHVQFGGGIRSMTQVQQLLELGVGRVVVGTQGVRNPEWLRELCVVFPGKIVLAVDARGRDVVVKGWTEATGIDVVTLARSLDDAGLAAFLYTNVDKEGRLQGMDKAVISDLRNNTPKTPLLVSGGIASLADLGWLGEHGIDGAVLGMSIYTGAIDLKAAVQTIPQPPYRPRRLIPVDPDDDLDDEVEEGPTDSKGFIQVLRAREDAIEDVVAEDAEE
ncbi:MAG: phosphoribosylformimino-5-aminoimidazole carboxamide ribotide isomerase [Thermoplasmata archaeon]|jgi:phosphoribosylformimino-5-aminoimidazole carboxamide ribotide isomerase|nr:phosphoribosylformimino-5-aminoimidazole carboxamide ribotide isomerase [Thermoplasmata archaeon]MEA3166935.1 phosphoribosylformimino-5-aminoimidazole carboxamide ribotide isomerase [Thermoplasmata archaeon]